MPDVIAVRSWQFVTIGLCLLILFYASLAEAALVRTDLGRARQLAEEKRRGARHLAYLIQHRQEVLSSLVVLINLAVIVASAFTTSLTIAFSRGRLGWVPLTSLGMIVFILVFCELTPKTYAVGRAEHLALAVAPSLRAVHAALRPLTIGLHAIGMWLNRRLVVPVLGGEVTATWARYTDEEVIELVAAGEAGGGVEEGEAEMIEGVIEFADKVVREVMTPRTDMITVPAKTPLVAAARVSSDTGYSRLPVYEGDVDHITGILYAKDMVAVLQSDGPDTAAGTIARQPVMVPETRGLHETLQMMQRSRLHMVIVIDEYGGTAGLVTIEDLIEEIFGEIQDEYDFHEEEPIQRRDENTLIVDGRVSIGEIEDEFEVKLPEGDFDSVGGFILDQLGRLPEAGEQVIWQNLEFTVESVSENRVQVVQIVRHPPAPEEEHEE